VHRAHQPIGDDSRALHSVSLPFTQTQFIEVMARYNQAVTPLQIGLVFLGLSAYVALIVRRRDSDRVISAGLAGLWLWAGIVYHAMFFRAINAAATLFAAAFIAAALAFLWAGLRGRLVFDVKSRTRRIAGHALIAYALIGYPLLSLLLGREFAQLPTFGLPCPTTIFTIGMLAFAAPPVPRFVFAIRVAGALIGAQAAFLLGVYEDLGLLVAGLIGAWLAFEPSAKPRSA
jgi:hypothetical protein